jgi:ABC-type sulfate/molybdate transport systems ATPase subunit
MSKTLADEPYVLLMDEPFAAVDAQTRAELEDLARSVWPRTGVTILFVSDPRFTRLRTHVYAQIQQAKPGRDQTAPPSPEGATVAPGS